MFKVDGVGIKRGVCGKVFEFLFYGCKDVGFDGIWFDVRSLSGKFYFVEIYIEFDGFLKCCFVLFESGLYKILVKYFGKEIF